MVDTAPPFLRGIRKVVHLPSTSPAKIDSISLSLDGRVLSLLDLCQLYTDSAGKASPHFLATLKGWQAHCPGELVELTQSLITLAPGGFHPDPVALEDLLLELLLAHHEMPEALHLSCQLIKGWNAAFITERTIRHNFCELVRSRLAAISISGENSERVRDLDARHIIIRAFEATTLREQASRMITQILSNHDTRLFHERRALALQFLTATRHQHGFAEMKSLASTAFASSLATETQTSQANRSCRLSPEPGRGDAHLPIAERHNARTKLLLETVLSGNGAREVARLTPRDFQALRTITGLSLDTFRLLCERLRMRAVSDPWARATILEIARAPHDSSVTSSVRTSILGSLVSEARKIGKLSAELEKEVYAASAEIPAMGHIEGLNHPDAETTPPLSQSEEGHSE